jgi:probable rRNA maturation factor
MREGEDTHLYPELLGDVIISTQTADREARRRGITIQEETALLLVHGILHLLGYDHERDPDEAAAMELKEQEIMRRLGFIGNE